MPSFLQKIKDAFTDRKKHYKKQKNRRDSSTNSNISPGSTSAPRINSGGAAIVAQGQNDIPNGLSSNALDGPQGTHLRASNAGAPGISPEQPKVVSERERSEERSPGPRSIDDMVAQEPSDGAADKLPIAEEPFEAMPEELSDLKRVESVQQHNPAPIEAPLKVADLREAKPVEPSDLKRVESVQQNNPAPIEEPLKEANLREAKPVEPSGLKKVDSIQPQEDSSAAAGELRKEEQSEEAPEAHDLKKLDSVQPGTAEERKEEWENTLKEHSTLTQEAKDQTGRNDAEQATFHEEVEPSKKKKKNKKKKKSANR